VTSLRSHHGIPIYRPETAEADGWMNLTRAAAVLGISPKTQPRRRRSKPKLQSVLSTVSAVADPSPQDNEIDSQIYLYQ
jgi:hypothetical protein